MKYLSEILQAPQSHNRKTNYSKNSYVAAATPPVLLEADPLYPVEPEIGVFALEAILLLEPEV